MLICSAELLPETELVFRHANDQKHRTIVALIVYKIMLIHSLYLISGIALLFGGANILIDGSKSLSIKLGIRPLIVGLTVVAFGTSVPELVISLISSFKNAQSLAVGNIVGSNIANIALVLGIVAIIKPIKSNIQSIKVDFPVMLFIAIIFYLFSLNGTLTRLEGFLLIMIFLSYIFFCAKTVKDKNNSDPMRAEASKSKIYYLTKTFIGVIIVVGGAELLVRGGIFWARNFGVSEIVIGLTVFAVGTSLPEIATSTMAILKNESDISMGNIIGSNIQNIALVIALVACITPLTIPEISLKSDLIIMLVYSFALYVILLLRKNLTRSIGVIFLISYIIYTFYLYFR